MTLKCRVSAKKKKPTDSQAAIMSTPFGGNIVLAAMGEATRLLHDEEAAAVETALAQFGLNEWRWAGFTEGGRG